MMRTIQSAGLAAFFLIIPIWLGAQQNTLVVQTGNSGEINLLEFDHTGNYLASVGEGQVISVWHIPIRKQYAGISSFSKTSDIAFSKIAHQIAAVGDSKLQLWDYSNQKMLKEVNLEGAVQIEVLSNGDFLVLGNKLHRISPDLENISDVDYRMPVARYDQLAASSDGKYCAIYNANAKGVEILDITNNTLKKRLDERAVNVSFSDDNQYLIVAHRTGLITRHNLQSNGEKTLATANRRYNNYNGIAISGKNAVIGNKNDVLTHVDLDNSSVVNNMKNHTKKVSCLSLSKSGGLLAAAGEDGLIILWDLMSHEPIEKLHGVGANVQDIKSGKKEAVLNIAYRNGAIKQWDIITNDIQTTAYKPKWKERLFGDKFIPLNLSENQITYFVERQSPIFNKKKYFIRNADWDKATGNIKWKEKGKSVMATYLEDQPSHQSNLSSPVGVTYNTETYHPMTGFSFAGAQNGLIYVHNTKGELVSKMLSSGETGFIYLSKDNYYFASKDALNDVGYKVNGQLLGFEQSDIKYNRPDLVLSPFPFYDSTTLISLYKAYQKRIEKLGITEQQLKAEWDIPILKITNTNIPTRVDSEVFVIDIEASDVGKHELKSLHVLVNGVPLYGKEGRKISGSKIDKSLNVHLSDGTNKVQVFCKNTVGFSSNRGEVVIDYNRSYEPSLYLLSIGSGKFSNNNYNLQYASKDAQDIASNYKKNKRYKDKHIVTITDDEVTPGRIEKELENLQKADIDDLVMVFFAGHGLIDDQLEYYLSTSKTAFEDPSKGSIAYDWFEQELSKIKSRQKVVFIDACHSGEIDKSDVKLQLTSNTSQEEVTFRAIGNTLTTQKALNFNSTLELSKNLFADMRSSSGAVVISSAGGGEFAIEGGQWKNGVFTYAMLLGMQDEEADLNKNGHITINELQQFLKKAVPKMTNGMQTPTFRVENLDQNFIVW